ncbi:hypothetical protein G6011_04854 [Alternaria panax]|uniref:F-box domain-containing protein n=1 Tax=Alternaria panax TaxID=48097 RepID=A0AAD4IHW9_9PLEO|nr:hypothetical protein G6011_04854 [Alternaria panax]
MASVQQSAQRVWTLPLATSNTTKPLAIALATYPIQEALVSFLTPDDLIVLALVSQTLHSHIRMDDANAKANLLSKTLCPGLGFYVRAVSHCPCPAKTFELIIGCAGFGFATESRPCGECGVNTCDECRIHVLYNSLTEDSGFDQRRWWAGFYFLQPEAIAVYPPKKPEDSAWHLPIKDMKPVHDQGRLHVPLDVIAIGDPEPFQRILDLDLGIHQSIDPVGRTQYPYSGIQIVSALNMIVNKRRDLACPLCYQERRKERRARCSCTLRKRFLDRWLCATCYIKEDSADEELRCHIPVADEVGEGHSHVCGCGAGFAPEATPKVMCNWCKGEIEGPQQGAKDYVAGEDSEGVNDEEEEEEDHDEDHSAADFANIPQDEFGFAENHDQSLSVYVNGECIRGERLGRSMVCQWMTILGKHVECTCCVCNSQSAHHTHVGDEEEDRDGENEGWNIADGAMRDDDSSDDEDLPDLEEVESAAAVEDQWGLD